MVFAQEWLLKQEDSLLQEEEQREEKLYQHKLFNG
mgnify:CR=1 FL=1|jgi:hypothetical protein